jgi:predicted Rossmann fold nucleotide-binding protein DprA/Smf involved in DNA uptake
VQSIAADAIAEAIPVEPKTTAPVFNLTESQRLILDQLDTEPIGVDQICDGTGLDVSLVMRELTFLSLKGAVQRVDGQKYKTR